LAGEDAAIEVDARRHPPRAEVVESRRKTPKTPSPKRGAAAVAKGRNGGSPITAATMFGGLG